MSRWLRRRALDVSVAGFIAGLALSVSSPAPDAARSAMARGHVMSIDPVTRHLTLAAPSRSRVRVHVPLTALLLRTDAGIASMEEAYPISWPDIREGDRVMLRGALSREQKGELVAETVVLLGTPAPPPVRVASARLR
jgi:hypothetical protein